MSEPKNPLKTYLVEIEYEEQLVNVNALDEDDAITAALDWYDAEMEECGAPPSVSEIRVVDNPHGEGEVYA